VIMIDELIVIFNLFSRSLIDCYFFAIPQICAVEFIHYMYNPARQILPNFTISQLQFNYYFWTVYKFIGLYYFCLAVCMAFGQIGELC
jgi:hypothetical protein